MVQIEYPQFITPEKYDEYLAKGWFRSSFMMYKSEILCINNGLSSIVNIRLALKGFEFKKQHRKLLNKNDKLFDVQMVNLNLNDEAEYLYQQQKAKFQGFVHSNLKDYLFANMEMVPYNTKQVEVRSEGRLVALSFVDLGLSSMASILGLYDLEMSKFSLGNYTMLKEIEFGMNTGMNWYYPGYILDQESSFNYKLKFGACQYLNENLEWVPFIEFNTQSCKAHKIREKTRIAIDELNNRSLSNKKWYYPYFSFGFLSAHTDARFLDKALFIEISTDGFHKQIIAYDVQMDLYLYENIWPFSEPERFMNIDPSQEYLKDESCYMTLSEREVMDSDRDIKRLLTRILI